MMKKFALTSGASLATIPLSGELRLTLGGKQAERKAWKARHQKGDER